jgi:hypothetical protein
MYAAQDKIKSLGARVVSSVPMISFDDITAAMPDMGDMEELYRKCPEILKIASNTSIAFGLRDCLGDYLAQFESGPQTIEGLIEFNTLHADQEFTPGRIVNYLMRRLANIQRQ